MNFLKDIYKFLNYLTFIDIIFFTAIIVLLILLVTLLYFIKINRDDYDDSIDIDNNNNNNNDKKDPVNMIIENLGLEETPNNKEEEYNDEEGELLDLEGLTKKLKEEKEEQANISKYEQDQEEKAIISYDELLKKHNKYAVNYEKEEIMDDLIVKKVNLNDLVNPNANDDNLQVRVISYQKEEAFLNALKELNRLLN